ncbi:MAG: hypothetical protein KIT25_10565 [Enhydrobacter sp.]|nr:MAG: hypothetical protein KIT25_10565 [Enhydrobacter sp.]
MLQARHAPSATVLLERDGEYFVYEPGLALVASGDTVESAYRSFSEGKKALFENARRAGLTTGEASVASAAGFVAGRGFFGELGLFLTKTCIVLLIIGGIGVTAATALDKAISGLSAEVARVSAGVADVLKGVGSISMVDIANKAAVIVQDVQAMPADRKESLRQSIGILSREATPIVEAWRSPPTSPTGTAPRSPPSP